MAPLEPTWSRPSHGDIQEVHIAKDGEFTSKSLSKVRLPPFAVYAKMSFPPCTLAENATYATVQIGRDRHLNLNSDLLYINHSCQPSLIFDTANFNILAGPNGLEPGQELTFFYPSTEWHMAQPFDCLCGEPTCRGQISGAKDMSRAQLEGVWLNGHIRELLDQRDAARAVNGAKSNGTKPPQHTGAVPVRPAHITRLDTFGGPLDGAAVHAEQATEDPTAQALRDAVKQAERVVEAAKTALRSYMETSTAPSKDDASRRNGASHGGNGTAAVGAVMGSERRGPTSRELSGEMGGDTSTF